MSQPPGIAGIFDRVSDTYDQVGIDFFKPIAARLVAELDPQPGERALDLGCGRGAVLIPLGRAVGATGTVSGIDLSGRMVEATRVLAQEAGLAATVQVGDAQSPDLPAESFEVIGSSLVLFFLPDPQGAVGAWRELLVDGGRLGVSTFGDYASDWQSVDAVFGPYLPAGMRDARTTGRVGPFASDAGVEGLLTGAGFRQVRTAREVVSVRFEDPDHWYRWSWSVGQRAMWEAIPEQKHEEVRTQAFEALERTRDDQGRIGFDQHVRFTLGVR